MAITNQSKPGGTEDTKLNIGSTFNLIVGGVFDLLIGIGSGGLTNQNKVSVGETWDTVTTSWATEAQTWQGASHLITNIGIIANIWESRTLPWTSPAPWLLVGGGITNQNKP